MKKILTLIISFIAVLSLCVAVDSIVNAEEQQESVMYFTYGRYYFTADLQGQVLTEDGNIWDYTQDVISDKPSYNSEPVIACFDDKGTPNDIYDDEIVSLVLDRETAIYDELETSLSEAFEVERNGNNIRISMLREVE